MNRAQFLAAFKKQVNATTNLRIDAIKLAARIEQQMPNFHHEKAHLRAAVGQLPKWHLDGAALRLGSMCPITAIDRRGLNATTAGVVAQRLGISRALHQEIVMAADNDFNLLAGLPRAKAMRKAMLAIVRNANTRVAVAWKGQP